MTIQVPQGATDHRVFFHLSYDIALVLTTIYRVLRFVNVQNPHMYVLFGNTHVLFFGDTLSLFPSRGNLDSIGMLLFYLFMAIFMVVAR